MYIEEEVSRLLEIQRANCYVAVLTTYEEAEDEGINQLIKLAKQQDNGKLR